MACVRVVADKTAAELTADNPRLTRGQMLVETDTGKAKVNFHTQAPVAWNSLHYWSPGGTSGGGGSLEVPTGTVNGINDTFVCSGPPIQVFLRKLLQLEGTDYTVASSTITFDAGNIPQTGDEIQVMV